MSTGREAIVTVALTTVAIIGIAYFLFRPESLSVDTVEPVPSEGGLHLMKNELPPGKRLFVPTAEWQAVEDDHICPAGLEYKLNVYDGTKFARLVPAQSLA